MEDSEIKIEKGVQIPRKRCEKPNNMGRKYPFDKMEIGDSFAIECDPNDKKKKSLIQQALSSSGNAYCKKIKRINKEDRTKFSVRWNNNKEMRVWRIN